MKKHSFAGGFEKIAVADLESSKKTFKDMAETHAEGGAQAIRQRHRSMLHYLLNPHTKGPLSEAAHRLGRRQFAALHDKPYSSMSIPLYAEIRGGDIGKKVIEKAEQEKTGGAMDKLRSLSAGQKALLAAGAAGAGLSALNVATAGHPESVKAHKEEAERLGRLAAKQKELRKGNLSGYLLNPFAHGPVSEAATRVARRMHASAVERPHLSALSPGLGAILGGKSGEKDASK
jgi:hypothetical protein